MGAEGRASMTAPPEHQEGQAGPSQAAFLGGCVLALLVAPVQAQNIGFPQSPTLLQQQQLQLQQQMQQQQQPPPLTPQDPQQPDQPAQPAIQPPVAPTTQPQQAPPQTLPQGTLPLTRQSSRYQSQAVADQTTDAAARVPVITFGLGTTLTATDNSTLGTGVPQNDLILEVTPRMFIHEQGSRFRLDGTASFTAYGFLEGTQQNRVLPEADLLARLEAVERTLYVDAALRALQTSVDPYTPLVAGTTANVTTVTIARVSPFIEQPVSDHSRYHIGADLTKTRESDSEAQSSRNGFYGFYRAWYERDPTPVGVRVEAQRERSTYDDATLVPSIIDTGRVIVDYAFNPEISAGLRGGVERNQFPGVFGNDDSWHSIYGGQFVWRPTERTYIGGYREKRFFGPAWELQITHRMRQFAINLRTSKTTQSVQQALFELPATDNVAALLNQVFATLEPNPAARAALVNNFLQSRGLPARTQSPIIIHSQGLSLVDGQSVNLIWSGVRNSVVVGFYKTKSNDLVGDNPLVANSALTNNEQRAGSVAFSHSLTRLTYLTLAYTDMHIKALLGGAFVADESTQRETRLQLNTRLAPRTFARAGVRYNKLTSNVVIPGHETLVYAGLDHTF